MNNLKNKRVTNGTNPWRVAVWCLSMLAPLCQGATNYPTPIGLGAETNSPYCYTGLIENSLFYGSGVVARDPKLVVSCAHVTYDRHWLKTPYWYWACNSENYPSQSKGLLMNGYVYWTSYARAARAYGPSSSAAFENDLVAYFNYSTDTAGGGYAEAWTDGVSALLTNSPKLITGYPAGRYRDGDPRQSQMHATGYFTNAGYIDRGRYIGIDGVETGAGNSGGPVWVSNGVSPLLAGVLVSGLEYSWDGISSVGVVGLDEDGWNLIESALSDVPQTSRSFSNTTTGSLPDIGTLTRVVNVSGMPKTITDLHVSLSVLHARRGDLVVTLRSPTHRTVTLFNGSVSDAGSNVTIDSRRCFSFDGLNPNGDWILRVRDRSGGSFGSFQNVILQISSK